MCLELRTAEQQVKKVAEHNMLCYKILHKDYQAVYEYYTYVRGKKPQKEVEIQMESSFYDSESLIVEEGYHSLKNKTSHMGRMYLTHKKFALFIAVIPKGASYYEGYDNDSDDIAYVSSNIIIVGRNTWWTRFKVKIGWI